jgi:hypothetical protein
MAMNADNESFAHDEDLSYPFSSPEGREAGRRGNGLLPRSPAPTPTGTRIRPT